MATCYPSLDDFKRLAGKGATAPVYRRLLADELTPVGAFLRLTEGASDAFLLESVVGGERIARYSFVGVSPRKVIRVKDRAGSIEHCDGTRHELVDVHDPLGELERLTVADASVPRECLVGGTACLPRFTGGAVGYAAYDSVRYYEKLPGTPRDDRALDDLRFGIYGEMVVFDHANKTVLVIATARLDGTALESVYREAVGRIERIVSILRRPPTGVPNALELERSNPPQFSSNFSQPEFEQAVRRSKDYILAGDIFQVVLSQRLRLEFAGDPFDVYRALRYVNPSPFMFYMKSPSAILIGASPEILCRVEDGVVTNRPLAGTRKRGATPAEDAEMESELIADPKDRAEHIMLVDLGRNDVGRVALPGSVQLTELMSVERYSHVMHLSSNVTGKLAPGKTAMDALRAALPVGTVSGAPKVRAMEIIDEMEPVRRGPYGGAVGYLDLAGNMDMCIALRTMVATPGNGAGEWKIDVQAGAGIVADSDPTAEFEETMNKAKALLSAIGIAAG